MYFASNIFSRYFKQFDWVAILDEIFLNLFRCLIILFKAANNFSMYLSEKSYPS